VKPVVGSSASAGAILDDAAACFRRLFRETSAAFDALRARRELETALSRIAGLEVVTPVCCGWPGQQIRCASRPPRRLKVVGDKSLIEICPQCRDASGELTSR
jgi:hypothetical protein